MLQSRPAIFNCLLTLLSLTLLTALSSCNIGDADNGLVHIRNHTDRTIRVFYDYEENIGDAIDNYFNTETRSDAINIKAGSSTLVRIQSNIFFEGEVKVVYGGILKRFDVNFSLLDLADLDIYTSPFQNVILASVSSNAQ